MNSIGQWLGEHGLYRYTEVFQNNAIDFDVLHELTETDLKEFGIPFGDRKRILQAVNTLARHDPATSRYSEVERRQLTVMFCDLVGSTALSAQLDPEEYRKIIVNYRTAVAQAISPYAGYIALYMGDGMLILFGYPQAHEDDAERAVRAGLAIVDTVQQLPPCAGTDLQVRMGIATGLVVIGDIHGKGVMENNAVLGDTPNLAARLQGISEPNTIVISTDTRHLTAELFEYQDLGRHQLKGISEPAPAWRVIRSTTPESRFEAVRGNSLTPMFGRDQELALLLERWAKAKERNGQVVLLVGEPGIGKSRITRALQEQLTDERYIRLRYQCSPYFNHSALYPIISQLEWASGIDTQDTPKMKLEKLQHSLLPTKTPLEETLALLANLMSIPTEPYLARYELPPDQMRERTLEVLVEQVLGLENRAPVLLIFEDVHWVDPTTLELLGHLIERLKNTHTLLVLTFRPEFTPPWKGYDHITTLALNRLTRSQGAAIVNALTESSPLPPEVLKRMLETTDGVPLFVEEMTKAVVESFSQFGRAIAENIDNDDMPFAIPSTLRDSLMARFDRLGDAKEVMQVGAAIGREFSYKLYSAVTSLSRSQLLAALKEIIRSELVLEVGKPPESSYVFKHALLQEVAYTTMLQEKRRQLHSTIASVLEQQFPAIAETRPEILARHYVEAGLVNKAIEFLMRAGQRAASQSANVEAIAHCQRALKLLEKLPPQASRDDLELKLLTMLAGSLIASSGYATPQLESVINRAWALANRSDNPMPLFPILHGRYLMLSVAGQTVKAFKIAKKIDELRQRDVLPFVHMVSHRILGTSHFLLGRFEQALTHLDKALELYDPNQHVLLAVELGHDIRVATTAVKAITHWKIGNHDQAFALEAAAVAFAESIKHANSQGYALAHSTMLYGIAGLHDRQLQRANELIALAQEKELPVWQAAGGFIRGWAIAGQGDIDQGLVLMQQSHEALQHIGMRYWQPLILCQLALYTALSGDVDSALAKLDEAGAISRNGGETWYDAERLRIAARIGAGPA